MSDHVISNPPGTGSAPGISPEPAPGTAPIPAAPAGRPARRRGGAASSSTTPYATKSSSSGLASSTGCGTATSSARWERYVPPSSAWSSASPPAGGGGLLDEVLQMITNIMVMIPSLVLLIVIGAYLKTRGVLFEGVFIGATTWPWVARAVRAQTFTLRSRDFVDLARLSGKRPASIVIRDIAPNMASYLFLVVVLLFGSSMLLAASYDFLGLGPTNAISLGTMMNQSMLWSALQLHIWWWFIAPGLVLTGMVAALLIANVGLDEIFNPKLRQQ